MHDTAKIVDKVNQFRVFPFKHHNFYLNVVLTFSRSLTSDLTLQLHFFKDFIFLFIDREREGQRHRQREKQASCREPDVGLNPGTPGSSPGLQAALNSCATGAAQ